MQRPMLSRRKLVLAAVGVVGTIAAGTVVAAALMPAASDNGIGGNGQAAAGGDAPQGGTRGASPVEGSGTKGGSRSGKDAAGVGGPQDDGTGVGQSGDASGDGMSSSVVDGSYSGEGPPSSGSSIGGGGSGSQPGSGGNAGAGAGGGSGGGGAAGGGQPSDPNAGRTWHPPWDEWVESGYWDTQYIEHPALYGERAVYGTRCNECGFTIQGRIMPHMEASEHFGYSTGVQIGTERYLAQEAWTEEKQVWVDTSHTVHHPGYWE